MELKDLTDGFESISRRFPLPKYAVSMVHGRMDQATKDYEMARFKKGETNILVATTVIEVGVDVPNASVMVIENAERFGLSQLHQLRGRVGRGAEQSFCILMTGDKLGNDARARIETMVRTNDGFEIAETDLRLRGPGDLMGTQQSGMPELHIADLVQDARPVAASPPGGHAHAGLDPGLSEPTPRSRSHGRFQNGCRTDRCGEGSVELRWQSAALRRISSGSSTCTSAPDAISTWAMRVGEHHRPRCMVERARKRFVANRLSEAMKNAAPINTKQEAVQEGASEAQGGAARP